MTFADKLRALVDQLRAAGPDPERPETYDEIMARYRQQAHAKPKTAPMGINGGKFGNAARGAVDTVRSVGNEIPGSFSNYGEGREQGMEILMDFLRRKFGR